MGRRHLPMGKPGGYGCDNMKARFPEVSALPIQVGPQTA